MRQILFLILSHFAINAVKLQVNNKITFLISEAQHSSRGPETAPQRRSVKFRVFESEFIKKRQCEKLQECNNHLLDFEDAKEKPHGRQKISTKSKLVIILQLYYWSLIPTLISHVLSLCIA